ncbi:hypothetical protein BKI52_05200 [marine bacterium AO1-C]|nr:hypothetical protein BKI52_05200 [marine bacterium AO1-C]
MNRSAIIVWALVGLSSIAFAQNSIQTFTFTNINSSQGLSQNTINCIIQDRKGFLWFGTADGLNRYDGYQFKVYRNELNNLNSLSNNYILSLLEDKHGNIWIGTYGGGLNKFNPNTETFTRYPFNRKYQQDVGAENVGTLYEDMDGKIWMGFLNDNNALGYLDPQTQAIKCFGTNDVDDPLHPRKIFAFIPHQGKGFWLASQRGLGYFDKQQGKYTKLISLNKYPNKNYALRWVYQVFRDKTKPYILWLCTFNAGLVRFDIRTEKITGRWEKNLADDHSLQTNTIWSFYQDKQGNNWVGTKNGFYQFNISTNKFTRYLHDPKNPRSIAGNYIQHIFEDQAGTVWLGSYNNGISAFTPKLKNFVHYPAPQKDISQVAAFCEDHQGHVWIGTKGGNKGLFRLNREKELIEPFDLKLRSLQKMSSIDINSLFTDVEGNIWIGTFDKGLCRYNPQTSQLVHHPFVYSTKKFRLPHIGAIYQDKNQPQDIWIGAKFSGFFKFNTRKNKFTKRYLRNNGTRLSHPSINAFAKDFRGNLWIATRGGLNRFNPQKEQFSNYLHSAQDTTSLSNDYVTCLHIDKQHQFWVGTRNGLNKLDLKELYLGKTKFKRYTTSEGLPSNIIHKIIEDAQGFLWISTSNGLSRFDKKNNVFNNYDEQDGLQSNEFVEGSGLMAKDGAIFLGGIKGFNMFYPSNIKKNTFAAPIVFTDFQLFNKSVAVGKQKKLKKPIWITDTLTLSHEDKIISFEFAALNYILPHKNTYKVRLENYDDQWRYLGHKHSVSYTNLPAGRYVLRVKSANNDGVWSPKEARMVIIIQPPWWQTWWFRSIIVLLIFSILVSVLYLIQKRKKHISILQKNNEALQKNLIQWQIKALSIESEQSLATKKSTKSTFKDSNEIEELKLKLYQVVIKQQLYKDENLSLSEVAKKMKISDKSLSELFNKELQTNFYEYINNCRVDAFKKKVEDGEAAHLTLMAIAYDSGFRSKSSFNRIFKQQTGLTPSQFKKKVEIVSKK